METLAKITQASRQLEGQEQMAAQREALSWISSESFASRQADLVSRLEISTFSSSSLTSSLPLAIQAMAEPGLREASTIA